MEIKEQILSDDDVVRAVQQGCTRDFEILVERYNKKIINFIHKMIFDYDEAQSLAQDVFIKVYEVLKNYKTQGNFQAFLFTIAKNLTLNYIKKQKRTLWFSKFLGNKEGNNDQQTENRFFQTPDTQHEMLEKSIRDEIVVKALKSLEENQRIALILKVYLDMSYNKISEITGWSIPKIETLISRAKSNLKKKILGNNMQETRQLNVMNVRTI